VARSLARVEPELANMSLSLGTGVPFMFMQRNVAYMLLIVMPRAGRPGLVMLSSTERVLAPSDMNGIYSNLRKQCAWLALGESRVPFRACDYQKCCVSRLRLDWRSSCSGCFFVPHVGLRINGSPRWLGQRHGWFVSTVGVRELALILSSWWRGKSASRPELNRGLTCRCFARFLSCCSWFCSRTTERPRSCWRSW